MDNYVFVVNKNTDFTEGRGAMVLHCIFDTFVAADIYVMDQEGIFGSAQTNPKKYFNLDSKDGAFWLYNGYSITKHIVLTEKDVITPHQKMKLTAELKDLDDRRAEIVKKLG